MKNPVYKIQIDEITIRCAEISDAKAQKEGVGVKNILIERVYKHSK